MFSEEEERRISEEMRVQSPKHRNITEYTEDEDARAIGVMDRIESLRTQLAASEIENEGLIDELRELRTQLNHSLGENSALRQEIADSQSRVEELECQKKAFIADLDWSQSKLAALELVWSSEVTDGPA